MKQHTITFAVFLIFVNFVISSRTPVEGYYWRDFEGTIPSDALPAGLDSSGKPLYIGQAYFANTLIPGKIYENDPAVYYAWGMGERTAAGDVKIFCTQYPNRFEWVPTNRHDIGSLTTRLVIKGGSGGGHFSYIGRAYSAGETSVGKILCNIRQCQGLFTTKDRRATRHERAFEILTYNPDIPASNSNPSCPFLDIVERSNTD